MTTRVSSQDDVRLKKHELMRWWGLVDRWPVTQLILARLILSLISNDMTKNPGTLGLGTRNPWLYFFILDGPGNDLLRMTRQRRTGGCSSLICLAIPRPNPLCPLRKAQLRGKEGYHDDDVGE